MLLSLRGRLRRRVLAAIRASYPQRPEPVSASGV
jgi:hypothetical protein